ncbi:hypothetical protein J2Z79_001705 [Symbiobacterium terraclitae]|uniref:Lipoprotein n=1 Tax=Symbiobacterium terraclitae TaxID=557451 RepID=A0ABS4JV15_9FIRM|nr:hypothetical protein [Symbiobacterium terraclitae]MBP2018304.1 hypothetical protein [Symbiobacterium terraclitae]
MVRNGYAPQRLVAGLLVTAAALYGCGSSLPPADPAPQSVVANGSPTAPDTPPAPASGNKAAADPGEPAASTDGAVPAVGPGGQASQIGGVIPFKGEFGGVLFKDQVEAAEMGCPPGGPVHEVGADAVDSPLIFRADFLGPEWRVTGGDQVALCGDRPISFAITAYAESGGHVKELNISRFAGRATTATGDPVEAYQEITVGDKPAVLIQRHPLPGTNPGDEHTYWELVILEEFGTSVISARWITRDELLAVAGQLP